MMRKQRLQSALRQTREALDGLKFSLSAYDKHTPGGNLRPVFFDACVKRFEVLFEYCWKLFKIAAEYQGSEALGPRPAIQEALKFRWIKDADFWAYALDARNGSVHDYFGVGEEEYAELMRRFLAAVPPALDKIAAVK